MSKMYSNLLAETWSVCTYCGSPNPTTSDHVPPQSLFPSPAPDNLITVPACKSCNNGAAKDDEFFRLVLVMNEKTKGNAAREAIVPAVKRSLLRFRAQGLASKFWSSTRSMDRFTADGLYVGEGLLFSTDAKRLDRTATRIVQGLFFHEFREPVPRDHDTSVINLQRLPTVDPVIREGMSEFIQATLSEPERTFGPAFSYWILRSPNGPHRAHFVLKFYGSLEYYAQVQPRTYSASEQEKAIEGLKELYREKGLIPPSNL
jgi:hypothetical protein